MFTKKKKSKKDDDDSPIGPSSDAFSEMLKRNSGKKTDKKKSIFTKKK